MLPFDIQAEIIKTFPVKSLLQFRSVSKAWKSLIDSSDFIKHYTGQQQHLLVRFHCPDPKYVSIVDDHTFPQQRVSLNLPMSAKMLKRSRIIGSSHGLLCLYYSRHDVSIGRSGVAVIWNISIRKAVDVVVHGHGPNVGGVMMYDTVLGFGVCRETTDPKIVKITCIDRRTDMESISCIGWQVEVFTLSTMVWRSPKGNLPRKSIRFGFFKVAIDGFLYWLATDRISIDDGFRFSNLIISFDMTTEEFREINFPDSLANRPSNELSIFELRKSLVVLEANANKRDVWMMEDGVSKSFAKLFTINVNGPDVTVKGFKKTSEPIIEIVEEVGTSSSGLKLLFSEHPYTETLLLVGWPTKSYSL